MAEMKGAESMTTVRSGSILRRVGPGDPLSHDPEKWIPVFRKDHAQTI